MIIQKRPNPYGKPKYDQYGRIHYTAIYSDLISNKFQNYGSLKVKDLIDSFDFEEEDKARFWDLQDDIRITLIRVSKLNLKPTERVYPLYLERERNQSEIRDTAKETKTTNIQKYTGWLNVGAAIATIIGLLIVVAYLIPETTPWLGTVWWWDFITSIIPSWR